MTPFVWVLFFIAISLCGCATPTNDTATPKYNIAAPKYKIEPRSQGDRTLDNWCTLKFTFTNTQTYPKDLWIKILVLDEGNNTVTERSVMFNTTLPGKTNEQQSPVNAN